MARKQFQRPFPTTFQPHSGLERPINRAFDQINQRRNTRRGARDILLANSSAGRGQGPQAGASAGQRLLGGPGASGTATGLSPTGQAAVSGLPPEIQALIGQKIGPLKDQELTPKKRRSNLEKVLSGEGLDPQKISQLGLGELIKLANVTTLSNARKLMAQQEETRQQKIKGSEQGIRESEANIENQQRIRGQQDRALDIQQQIADRGPKPPQELAVIRKARAFTEAINAVRNDPSEINVNTALALWVDLNQGNIMVKFLDTATPADKRRFVVEELAEGSFQEHGPAGPFDNVGEAQAAADAGRIKPGDRVTIGGKEFIFQAETQ